MTDNSSSVPDPALIPERRSGEEMWAPIDEALAKAVADELTRTQTNGVKRDFDLHKPGVFFEHAATHAFNEQEWFWSRFAAFATLHAGLFVFSRVETERPVDWILAAGGLFLGGIWMLVQSKSRHYVRQSKKRLHSFEIALGLRRHTGESSSEVHATDLGVWTSWAVFVMWAVALYTALSARA
jgi:hypothetical protein